MFACLSIRYVLLLFPCARDEKILIKDGLENLLKEAIKYGNLIDSTYILFSYFETNKENIKLLKT